MAVLQEAEQTLPRAATPEEVGISSQAILDLLEEYDRQGLEYHGLMILRHGKVAFETYRKPYAAEIPHSIYSFSKSIAGTAAGFAIDEGLFALDSRLCDLFPEYRPARAPKGWDDVTIRHVLTMTTGLVFDVFHQSGAGTDWVADYLHSRLRDVPGEVYHYTNENAYLISVLIRRLTGLGMFTYLQPRLFAPLGIEVPFTEADQAGNPAGGWGIIWKLEDSARFIQCYLDGGKWNGQQVIPAWWAEEATKTQAENKANLKADSNVGYGYQFWMCRLPNTFAARGMFCQQGMAMRDHDAVFVYFGADADEQKPFEVIYPHFPRGFVAEGTAADAKTLQALRVKEQNTRFPTPPVAKRSPLEAQLNGAVLHLRRQHFLNAIGFPLSLLPMTVNQMSLDRAGYIDAVRLDFTQGEVQFSWQEGKDGRWQLSVPLGLDGAYRTGHVALSGFSFDTYSYAHWQDDSTLALHIRPIQSCASRTFTLCFGKRHVKMIPGSTPSFTSIAQNLNKLSYAYLNNNRLLCKFSDLCFGLAPSIMEAPLRGRLKRREP